MPLTALLSITTGNTVGFPSPPLNPDPGDLTNTLEDIYEGSKISFDVIYQLYNESFPPGGPNVDATTSVDLISYTNGINGLTAQKVSDQVIRISGTPTGVFTDGYYTVLKKDGSVVDVSQSDTGDYVAVVGWSIPSTKIKDIIHEITANVKDLDTNEHEIITEQVTQDVYWRADLAVQAFREKLNRGSI